MTSGPRSYQLRYLLHLIGIVSCICLCLPTMLTGCSTSKVSNSTVEIGKDPNHRNTNQLFATENAAARYSYTDLINCGAYPATPNDSSQPFEESVQYLRGANRPHISPQWAKNLSTKTLRVGIIPDPAFFNSLSSHAGGYDIQLLSVLQDTISKRFHDLLPHARHKMSVFIKVIHHDTAIAALENNEIDAIMGGYDMTCGKSRYVEFTQPYMQGKLSSLTLSPTLATASSLSSRYVCTVSHTSYGYRLNHRIQQHGKRPAHIIYAEEMPQCVDKLLHHRVSAIVGSSQSLSMLSSITPTSHFHDDLSPIPLFFSIAVDKTNFSLAQILNNSINHILTTNSLPFSSH